MDKREFSDIIFGDNPVKREKWFELFKDPVWIPRYNISLPQQRDEAFKKLKKVTDNKMISVLDFEKDPVNVFTAHEFMG